MIQDRLILIKGILTPPVSLSKVTITVVSCGLLGPAGAAQDKTGLNRDHPGGAGGAPRRKTCQMTQHLMGVMGGVKWKREIIEKTCLLPSVIWYPNWTVVLIFTITEQLTFLKKIFKKPSGEFICTLSPLIETKAFIRPFTSHPFSVYFLKLCRLKSLLTNVAGFY